MYLCRFVLKEAGLQQQKCYFLLKVGLTCKACAWYMYSKVDSQSVVSVLLLWILCNTAVCWPACILGKWNHVHNSVPIAQKDCK